MTRAEYQTKYGKAPSVPTQTFNNDVPVTQMTRAEYESKYGVPLEEKKPLVEGIPGLRAPVTRQRIVESIQNLGTLYGGGEQGIANKLATNIQDAAKDIEGGHPIKGAVKGALRTAGDAASLIYAPVGEALNMTGLTDAFNYLGELSQKGGKYNPINLLTDIKAVQDFVAERPNLEEDFNRVLMLSLAAADAGKIDPKSAVQRTVDQLKASAPALPSGGVSGVISDVKSKFDASRQTSAIEGVKDEIYKVENHYTKTRKANRFLKDEGDASRERVARSGVLQDSVSTDGLIRTKQKGGPIDQYKEKTIKGYEGVVRKNLVREGKTANLGEAASRLRAELETSGMEGADLLTALNGIEKEISGLRLRADGTGNVPLEVFHDAKINHTNHVNYQTPPSEGTYRKTVARVYKQIVEDKSKTNVKKVNGEIQKFYQDIDLLERLDGLGVKGRKLGKYAAQLSGTMIGMGAGAMFGPAGAAAGGIVGGEAAGLIKGTAMSRTFNKEVGSHDLKSPVLERAKSRAEMLPIRDLEKPDPRAGAGKDIPKTKGILKIEREISENVEAQKAAIKTKDYMLVDHLKDVYEFLYEVLLVEIRKSKNAVKDEAAKKN